MKAAGVLGGLALLVNSSCGNNPGNTIGGNSGGGVVCSSPYIRNGSGCCLDQNFNRICDVDDNSGGNNNGGGSGGGGGNFGGGNGGNGGGNSGSTTNLYGITPGFYSGNMDCNDSETIENYSTPFSFQFSDSGVPYMPDGGVFRVGGIENFNDAGLNGLGEVTYVGFARDFAAAVSSPNALEIDEDVTISANGRSYTGQLISLFLSCEKEASTCRDLGYWQNNVMFYEELYIIIDGQEFGAVCSGALSR